MTDQGQTDEVLYEVADHVAVLTLNRPDRMNAATFDMADQLRARLAEADEDRDVRCIIITGAGRAFCSGDDVEAAWGDPRMARVMEELGSVRPPLTPEVRSLVDCTTPIIAAVNGVALGIGMDIALWADIIIAGQYAKFGQLFVKMGLMADVTGLWRLPQLIGHAATAELLYTGDIIDAERALALGMVSRVVDNDALLDEARGLAARIAANPPRAVAHMKEGLRRAAGRSTSDLDELGAYVGSSLAALFASADHKEAAAAFQEKREPVFTNA